MDPKIHKIKRILNAITSILIIVIGLGMIAGCISIYQSGDRPFSLESIAVPAAILAPAGIMCVLNIAAGSVLEIRFHETGREPVQRTEDQILHILRNKKGTPEPIAAEDKKQKLIRMIGLVVLVLFWIYPALYLMNSSNFSVEDVTADVLSASIPVFSAAAASIALEVIIQRMLRSSKQKQIELYKTAEPAELIPTSRSSISLWIPRAALLLIAVILIAAGINNQGIADVLGKAIRICTECIGLG